MSLEDTNAGSTGEPTVADATANGASSMEDTLKSTYRELMAKGAADSDESADTTDTAELTEGRQRGPDGKFLAAKTEETEPTTEETTEAEPVVAAQPKAHDTAPNTWRKEIAAEFGKLPENVREEIYRRENDFHKGIGQYKEAADFGTAMAQELLPYQQTMERHNVNARDVMKSMASSWNMLVTGSPEQKAQLVLQLVKDYGIDFASLGTNPQQGQTQPIQDDPRLATALQRLEKLEGTLTAQERQRAEAEFSQHVDLVQKFGSDPKNKHFTAVREDMAKLIESGWASDLQDAYDKAVWASPTVRPLLLAEQDKERADKAAKESAAARKASGANVTRRGTPPVPQKSGSIEDTIKSRYRELTT